MLAASMALVALAIFVVLSVVPRSGRQPSVVTAGGFAAEVPDRQRLDAMLKSRLAVANLDRLVTEPTLAWVGLLGVSGIGGWLLGQAIGALGGVFGAVLLPPAILRIVGDQSERRIEDALPYLLEATARNLRTGAPLLLSIRQAASTGGPTSGDLLQHDIDGILRSHANGVSVAECFDRWATERPFASVRMVVSTIHVGLLTGADLATPLELAADNLRSAAALRSEVSALAAQAKASVVVIGLAPLAFLGVATAAGTSVAQLFGSPLTALAMVAGVTLDVVGVWWMQRIIKRVVP